MLQPLSVVLYVVLACTTTILYAPVSVRAQVDSLAPTVSGNLTAAVGARPLDWTISWNAATDNIDASSLLQYQLYYSAADNMNTVENALANGIPYGVMVPNINSRSITFPTIGKWCVAVVVSDRSGNRAAYTSIRLNPEVIVVFAKGGNKVYGDIGGRTAANSRCAASANVPAGYTNIAGLLSTAPADNLRSGTAFTGMSGTAEVWSLYGKRAASVYGLLFSVLENSFATGGYGWPDDSLYWWSGSDSAGDYQTDSNNGEAGDTCLGWTSMSEVVRTRGVGLAHGFGNGPVLQNPGFINQNGEPCNSQFHLMCIAW
jgi:hypothetical protein